MEKILIFEKYLPRISLTMELLRTLTDALSSCKDLGKASIPLLIFSLLKIGSPSRTSSANLRNKPNSILKHFILD